jgi:hypothetical protein
VVVAGSSAALAGLAIRSTELATAAAANKLRRGLFFMGNVILREWMTAS